MSQNISPINLKAQLLKVSDQDFENQQFEEIALNQEDYKATFTNFVNVDFVAAFTMDGVNLSYGLQFTKCRFHDIVVFKDVVVDKYDQLKATDSVSIVFKNCTFSKRVKLYGRGTSIDRGVVFDNCVFEDGIEIDGIAIVREGLVFRRCTVKEKLDVFRSGFNRDLHFEANTIESYARLSNLKCSGISFTKENVFSGNLHIHSCKLVQGIIFNDGTFKDSVDFSLNRTQNSGLTVFRSTFEKDFNIGFHHGTVRPDRGIDKFYIDSAKFSNGFNVSGIQDLLTERPKVTEINISFSSLLTGNLQFRNLDVGTVIISGYNTSAKLTLKSLHVNQIKIQGFINEGGLIFSNFKASRTDWPDPINNANNRNTGFYIDDANFGKAQFFQTDFDSFDKIVFHNLIMTEISTSLVTWFTKEKLDDGEIALAIKDFSNKKALKKDIQLQNARRSLLAKLRSKREIFRQLKFAAQKQGDIPLSFEFQRWEMEYYHQIVDYEKPRRWSEFLILWSNQSNNFGQSWVRAFWGLVLFSFISYIPIGFLTSTELDYSKFARSCSDVLLNCRVIVYDNIKSWVVVLNPAHRINDFAEDITKYSNWLYLWDILSRIVVAYFIFQMVSAFRKFSK
ncbi:hypothetical protein ACXZ1K_12880 [Pedobacter sp. PWIIR3]